jgi:hypothetical protein
MGYAGLALYPLTFWFQATAAFAPVLLGWWGLLIIPIGFIVKGKDYYAKIQERLRIIHNSDHRDFTFKKLIPITKTYGSYILKMILPGRTLMIYPHLFYWGMTDKGNKHAYSLNLHFWLGFFALGCSVVPLFYLQGHLVWWWLFMVLSVLQWCGFISVTQMFTDRYISLSNMFMMYFVSYFAFQVEWTVPIIAGLIGYYIANLFVTFNMYKDMNAFHEYHMYWDASNPKCREFKAALLLKQKDILGAWHIISEGLKLNPTDMKLNMIAANCMSTMEDRKMVLYYLQQARLNVYIGQQYILDKMQKEILGFDIESEYHKVCEKGSGYDSKKRKTIVDMYEFLYSCADPKLPDVKV